MSSSAKIYPKIDPSLVPLKELNTGSKIPVIGLGTFGSDHASPLEVAEAVKKGIKLGYRHIDCASVYGNEKEIGSVLKLLIDEGEVKREDLWVTSKVWNDRHGPGDVLLSCAQTLKDLRLDYLDLYLIHWPFPNYHSPGCDANFRSPDSRPYIHENYMKTWRQMEKLCASGLVRNIGTSNMTIPKMKLLLRDCSIKPACNEMELHPHMQQPEFMSYLLDKGIQPIGYCPIGSPQRPERDRTATDTVDIEDPVIVRIANEHNVHPAVICIKWAVQRGEIVIPFSLKEKNMLSNISSIIEDPLTEKEMNEIATINKNCRLIKGHVFLWKDNQSWEDLWDTDGTITLP